MNLVHELQCKILTSMLSREVAQLQLLGAEDFPRMLTMFCYVHLLSSYQNQQPVSYFSYCCKWASQILFGPLGHWLHRDCNTMERTDNKIYSILILYLISNEKCTIVSVKYLWVGPWPPNISLCDIQNMGWEYLAVKV